MNPNGIVNFHQFQNNNKMLEKYNQTVQQNKDNNQYIQQPIENTQIPKYNNNPIINNNSFY